VPVSVTHEDKMNAFAGCLLSWFREHERDLPWRWGRPAYEIAVAVVMLQHTSVASAAPVFCRLVERYPTVERLAAADPEEVRALVGPLGLPARAERLVRLARAVVEQHGGAFPKDEAALRALPGIGHYGAATIACLAFGRRAAMIDVNVVRILARVFSVPGGTDARSLEAQRALLLRVLDTLPPGWAEHAAPVGSRRRTPGEQGSDTHAGRKTTAGGAYGAFSTALLDLGALVCTARRPKCPVCPAQPVCDYAQRRGAWCGRDSDAPEASR
jgi:A/G-specific adenine glycosylase